MKSGLQNMVYGMYLLTTRVDDRDFGCLVNTAIQVSSKPHRIAVCVVKSNLTHDAIAQAGIFNLSGLREDTPMELFRNFGMRSGRKADKFADMTGFDRSENGVLYPNKNATMSLSAQVTEQIDLDDHTLFIARVTDSRVLSDEPTLTYEQYLARGKSGN